MLHLFRKALVPAIILSCSFNAHAAENIKNSWLSTALKLQREIDINTPLREATFLGTHNSYNASAYEIPFLRYVDPNQILSLYDQLDVGVRSIELDAHWTTTKNFNKDILLCHGQPNHLGCSIFDRNITEGLEEIRNWLSDNPNEVVLLYIERHLDGHEPRLAAELERYLGEYIYKPSKVRPQSDNRKSCVSMPGTLTKANILSAGKQLLIVVKGCDGANPNYEEPDKFSETWNDYVFAGIGNMPTQPFTFLEALVGEFTPYPDCGKSKVFSPDPAHSGLWRVYEDRTILTDIIHPQKLLDADDMRELVRCGINWQTIDMLSVDDPRMKAAIWSWAPSYPKPDQGECSIYKYDQGIMNVPCKQTVIAYACQDEKTHTFKPVSATGQQADGEAMCQTAGKNWHFSVPVNGYQMNTLKERMKELSIQEAALNYVKIGETKRWFANHK